jgi:hypothetical protein
MTHDALMAERILAIRIGMDTAAEIVRQAWGPRFAKCVVDYERDFAAKTARREKGCRAMVEGDIFLRRPLMMWDDLYGAQRGEHQ